jgi:prepilin peptidase CpaA
MLLNTFLGRVDLSPGWPALRFSLIGFAIGFGVYLALYAVRAMGAGDVKLMAAVGTMVGWEDWFGIFVITAVIGGAMALILVVAKKRMTTTFMNVGVILHEMKSGRPAYLAKEELDVKNPKALGLPHGAVIAVGTLFFLAFAAHFTK